MNAECARPTCEEPARVLLAFDPRTARAWLRDLDNGDPSMGLLLCTEHAESTSVPVSWEIVDERRTVPEFSSQMYDSEPSFDDIFPPRAGYSNWDNIPYHDAPQAAPQPRPGAGYAERGADGAGYAERGEPRAQLDLDRFSSLGETELTEGPAPQTGTDRLAPASVDGAWYDDSGSGQPDWLERAASLDFGLDNYYDPYLDDPELNEVLEGPSTPPKPLNPPLSNPDPTMAGADPVGATLEQKPRVENPGNMVGETGTPQSPESTGGDQNGASAEPESTVAPLVRPGSPNEQIPATELLAAASVDPPQPMPPRPPSPSMRDPKSYKDAVRLPERADLSRHDGSQPEKSSDQSGDDLAASGTDGAPFPPHPGARNAGS